MEDKRQNSTWVWIVVAVIVGLLLTCVVSALVGGLAGYLAGQQAARSVPAPAAPREVPPTPTPLIPRLEIPSPEPVLPEGFPFGEETPVRALVMEVVSGSPAERAGLRAGDMITEIDGEPLFGEASLSQRIMDYAPGDEVELAVLRNSRQRTVTVRLGRHPELGGETPWLGIRYRSIPQLEFELERRRSD